MFHTVIEKKNQPKWTKFARDIAKAIQSFEDVRATVVAVLTMNGLIWGNFAIFLNTKNTYFWPILGGNRFFAILTHKTLFDHLRNHFKSILRSKIGLDLEDHILWF